MGPHTFVNSPSINEVDNSLFLWSVDTGSGCATQSSTVNVRTSTDGVKWSAPQALSISQPGYVIWHVNMIPVPAKGQWMSLVTGVPFRAQLHKYSTVLRQQPRRHSLADVPHADSQPRKGVGQQGDLPVVLAVRSELWAAPGVVLGVPGVEDKGRSNLARGIYAEDISRAMRQLADVQSFRELVSVFLLLQRVIRSFARDHDVVDVAFAQACR